MPIEPSFVLAAIPLLASYCSGVGWVFYAYVFRQLGLTPEEVGIDVQYLFVRSVLAIGVVLVLALVLVYLLGCKSHSKIEA